MSYTMKHLQLFEEFTDWLIVEKNVPNNPSLWASCKAWAKNTYDVYPSAYANGAAAKRYKSKGGTWRKSKVRKKKKR